ncbi:high-potential iron-sulfur protein [Polynucleobacter sp. CS-Odin-A6]|uniref:high-potential iron-sulfur protein n=1 Tax=Polynucleobacter sp. CS-Odin-A6 TaxID=2689106 RepID=UPI001C0D9000|nr:high-potential iron-sulfur protein [Polynucleobacter sp. CS-Odin-A6]MBU3620740.1 high-potential iron-sulfur protein [Polynucleobacter sp. CS-Odin-A6]
MEQKRRVFIMQVVAGLGTLTLGSQSSFAAYEKLTESDSYGKSMGFRLKSEDVDSAKYKRWTAEQKCSSCQLWSGKGDLSYGDCSFFERSVPSTGWCKNFKAKKAA